MRSQQLAGCRRSKGVAKHDAVAFADTWNRAAVGSGVDRYKSKRNHRRRSFHEPDSAYTVGHSLFERLSGGSRKTQEVRSAIGAENELMWSHRAGPYQRKQPQFRPE